MHDSICEGNDMFLAGKSSNSCDTLELMTVVTLKYTEKLNYFTFAVQHLTANSKEN